MIEIYLCDSNTEVLDQYQQRIKEICYEENYFVNIETFSCPTQLLTTLSKNLNTADIIFIDIELESINGLTVAKQLRQLQYEGEIVFMSMHHHFVFDSFDVIPFYYILKQHITPQKLDSIIKRVIEHGLRKKNEYFYCKTNKARMKLPLQDISYFTINARIATVYYQDTSFDFTTPMNELVLQLEDHGFFKCHRSFLINLRYIASIRHRNIYLKDGTIIPISQPYLRPLKLAFSQQFIRA